MSFPPSPRRWLSSAPRPAELAATGDTAAAIRAGEAVRTLKAPGSLAHRYYVEDFPFAVLPFLAFAGVAGIEAPLARALLTVAGALAGPGLLAGGLDACALGISGVDADGLLRMVRG